MIRRVAWLGMVGLAITAATALAQPPTGRGEMTEQQRLRAASPGGPITPGVELPKWPAPPNPLEHATPVTDALLANPVAERLAHLAAHSGRPRLLAAQSDRQERTWDELRLAWSLALPAGPNAATPLVHDGVIYVHSFGDNVQALDATTGDELWHYARELPNSSRPTVKRNLALYGDKLYFGTSDVHEVALDVKTGEVVWDTPITSAEQRLRPERRTAGRAR